MMLALMMLMINKMNETEAQARKCRLPASLTLAELLFNCWVVYIYRLTEYLIRMFFLVSKSMPNVFNSFIKWIVFLLRSKISDLESGNSDHQMLVLLFTRVKTTCNGFSVLLMHSYDRNGQTASHVSCSLSRSKEKGKKAPVTHRLVFINGVLDTPAALRDPGRVKHRDRRHSKHR